MASPITLLHMDGTGTSFTDVVGNTWTSNGTAQTTADSKFGGSSAYFAGTAATNSLKTAAIPLGTGPFTVDFWLKPEDYTTTQRIPFFGASNNTPVIAGNGSLTVKWYNGAYRDSGLSLNAGAWNHIAYVRDSDSNIYAYVNGVKGNLLCNTNVNISITEIGGADGVGNSPIKGYLDEFRALPAALWTYSFTPPSAPSAWQISDATRLLLHMEKSGTTFIDEAGHSVSVSGSPTQSTTQYKFGTKSGYFDGNSFIEVSTSNDLDFGTSPWTVDFWFYPSSSQTQIYPSMFGPTSTYGWTVGKAGTLGVRNGKYGYWRWPNDPLFYSSSNVIWNVWHHLALVRYGTTIKMYIDGVLEATGTIGVADVFNYSTSRIGSAETTNTNFVGYIDEVRITNAIVWTSAFTPPTSAYTWTPAPLLDVKIMGKPLRLAKMATLESSMDQSNLGALYYDTTLQKIVKYENTSSKWQNLVGDNEVTSSKMLLANNTALRGSKTDASILDIVKVDTSNVITFGVAQYRFNGVAYTFPASHGSSGQFLSNNGSGTLNFATLTSTLSGAYTNIATNFINTTSTYGSPTIAGTESLKITATNGFETTSQIKLKDDQMSVREFYKGFMTLTNNVSAQVLAALGFSSLVYGSINVEYTITEDIGTRVGRLRVSTDGTNVTISDDFTETADVGVTWSAVINGTNIEVKYTTTNLTNNRIMQATVKQFFNINLTDALADASYSKVSLKLTGEGSTILDTSPLHNTVTVAGNTVLSTAQVKNGVNSIFFPITAKSYVTLPYDVGFLGSADWTIEGWFYITNNTSGRVVFSQGLASSANYGYQLYFDPGDNNFKFLINTSTVHDSWAVVLWGLTVPRNVWVHIACVRYGTSVKMYKDGTAYTSGGNYTGTLSAGAIVGPRVPTNSPFYIGANDYGASVNAEMYVDDFRLTKGLARYTANFTP